MTEPDAARRHIAIGDNNLMLRVVSALVLAPLALAVAYFGGWAFAIFWGAAAIVVLWEWTTIAAGPGHRLMVSSCGGALAVATLIAERGRPIAAMMVIILGTLAAAIFAPRRLRAWIAAGVVYGGVMTLAPLALRADEQLGFAAIVLLFAVVWTTDIAGYFAGRAIGGPKLAPAISPKKTWSGAIAGALGAAVVGVVFARLAGRFDATAMAAVAVLLSVVAQLGDLLESAVKRRFGAKDASQLIPGHGGVMDRLDGFWAAALVGAAIGLARGGFENAASGLLIW